MKRYIFLIIGFVTVFFCSSCEMKKELFDDPAIEVDPSLENRGLLDLELIPNKEADIPDTRGGNISGSDVVVLDVNEFAVDILDANSTVVKHYDSYAELKEEGGLLLPPGKYSIRATLGDDVAAGFDAPFYSGTDVCEITPKEVAKVITDCVLSNKKVTFRCSDNFLKKFRDDYSIVVDNNAGALTTTINESRVAYLKNTGVLQFTIYATPKNNNRSLTYNYDMSKNESVQTYNNILVDLDLVDNTPSVDPDEPVEPDDEPVDPGDPEEPEEPVDSGAVKAPIIKVDISLIEKDFIIEVPSTFVDAGDTGETDKPEDSPSDGDDSNNPKVSGKGFDISKPLTIKMTEAESAQVAILIETPGRLESLKVSMSSSHGKFEAALKLIELDSSFDLCALTEKQEEKLTDPTVGISPVQKGRTSTTFDISNFMGMISSTMGEGEYYFNVTVTDKAGKQASAKLTLVMQK